MNEAEEYWLEQLLEKDEGLSEWEITFITSIDERDHSRPLSEAQSSKLKQLYEKHC